MHYFMIKINHIFRFFSSYFFMLGHRNLKQSFDLPNESKQEDFPKLS